MKLKQVMAIDSQKKLRHPNLVHHGLVSRPLELSASLSCIIVNNMVIPLRDIT